MSTEPELWRAIVSRLDPAPESTSIDSVTAALGGAVGRGTVQRIRDGVPGTSMKSLTAIAKQLDCSVSDLFEPEAAPPARSKEKPLSPSNLKDSLTLIRSHLLAASAEQADAVGESLKLLARVPDSDRAFDQALMQLSALNAKNLAR